MRSLINSGILMLFIHSSIHLFIHPSIHLFIHPSIHSFIHPSIHTSIHSYIHSFINPFIHPSIHSFINIDILTSKFESWVYLQFYVILLYLQLYSNLYFTSTNRCISGLIPSFFALEYQLAILFKL